MFWGEQGWTESGVSLAKVEVEATELDRRMPTTANHWFAFKVREGSEAKKPDSIKLQVSENVSRKREKKMIMQIYVSFVPNLTSSGVCLLPCSALPSFAPQQVFPQHTKKMQIYIISKNVKPPPLATGMLCFFLHSLKVRRMSHLRFWKFSRN